MTKAKQATFCCCNDFTLSTLTFLICNRIQEQRRTKTFIWICQTYGSVDLGIMVPSSFIRSLMLNLLLLSTAEKHEWQAEKTPIRFSGPVFEGKEIHQSKVADLHWLTEVMVVFLLPFFQESFRIGFWKTNKKKTFIVLITINSLIITSINVTLPVISLLIFGRSAGQELLTVRVGAAIPGLW